MLETIRRHQQSWLTYLIFLAIIVVFAVNFGPGSSSCRQGVAGSSSAATVDGESIGQQEFALTYSHRLETMRRRAQASHFDFTVDMADKMGMRKEVIDQLIDVKLLAHEATRRGLKISDDELLEYLENTYHIKDVSPEEYRNFVERNFHTNVTRFEDGLREELLGQKMARLVTDNVTVGDAELKKSFMREHDRAMIEYVRYDLGSAGVPEPTAAEITKLLGSEHKAVEDRYAAESYKYRTAEQRHARQIMRKVATDASEADVAKARSELLELKGQIEGGADFAALAKDHSDDAATKVQGGDLGVVKRGTLPKSVEDAVFALKHNDMSKEPVRSPFGLHLVQVTEITPPAQRPLAEVERDVASSLLRERSEDAKAQAEATALLAQLHAGKSLASLSQSDKEAKPDDEGAGKGAGKSKAKGKAVVAVVKPLRHESPWLIQADEALAGIGIAPELHSEIFALTKQAPVAKAIHKAGRAYYVVVLKDREAPDLARFESDKDSLRDQALWGKRRQVYEAWVKQLRTVAKVDVNPGILGGKNAPAPDADS